MTRVLVVDDDPAIRAYARRSTCGPAATRWTAAGDGALGPAGGRRAGARRGRCSTSACPTWTGSTVLGRLRAMDRGAGDRAVRARTESDDKVEALDVGADDYVTKPFGPGGAAGPGAGGHPPRPAAESPALRRGGRRPGRSTSPTAPAGRDGEERPPDPDRVADRRAPGPSPRAAGAPERPAARRVGPAPTIGRPTTCGSTCPASGASSSATRRIRGSSSPSRAWATASSPEDDKKSGLTVC